ncbi:MAG: hypothetical protein E7356_01850 [Clostridiales bacterium]|nr:hypothetical protein [Clostridiales bacterium]
MEKFKKNINRTFNGLIASVTLMLVAIIIALGFFTPKSLFAADNGVDSQYIADKGIYFNAGLTNIKSATGLTRRINTGIKSTSDTEAEHSFYAYEYNYNSYPEIYYTQLNSTNTSTKEIISIASGAYADSPVNETIYSSPETSVLDRIGYSDSGFIPYGVTHFNNSSNSIEKIFHSQVSNNDYVLINNYDTFQQGNFDVENFYLSFGSPYVDEHTTTPLNELQVSGRLLENGNIHDLQLNAVQEIAIDGTSNGRKAHFWNQYFDLNNLRAYKHRESSASTYAIENTQGRYEITFLFNAYNQDNMNEVEERKSFTFSFYLLDSADYSNYPTISNANILTSDTTITPNTTVEYFYNFNTSAPKLTYNPKSYNLAYTRNNNKSVNNVSDYVTSTFAEKSYTKDGVNYPHGIITYSVDSRIIKEVHILTYYNADKSVVEHLYVSATNPASAFSGNTYKAFTDALDNDTLKFEYKVTNVLTKTGTEYKTTSYKTSTYKNLVINDTLTPLIANQIVSVDSKFNLKDGTVGYDEKTSETSYTVNIDADQDISVTQGSSTVNLVGRISNTVNYSTLQSGIILKNEDLTTDAGTLQANINSQYTLSSQDNKYILSKTYVNPNDTDKTVTDIVAQIELNNYIKSTMVEIKPAGSHVVYIFDIVVDGNTQSIASVTFKNDSNLTLSNPVNLNQDILTEVLDLDSKQLSLDYEYELVLEELGVYEFIYSYIVNANNQFVVNSTLEDAPNSALSTNYTAPINFATQKTVTDKSETSSSELTAHVSTPIVAGKTTLMGEVLSYEAGKDYVVDINNNSYKLDDPTVKINGIDTKLTVRTIDGTTYLTAYFTVGTIAIQTTTTTTSYSIDGGKIISVVEDKVVSKTYTLDNSISISYSPLSELLSKVANKQVITTESYTYSAINGRDELHIFGSITYFSKDEIYSDSNYAKLEHVDSKLELNYRADITDRYIDTYNTTGYLSRSAVNASSFKGKIASLLTLDEIVVTNITPVLWNNFSTLFYDPNDSTTSLSRVYRYTKYTTDANTGRIVPDTSSCITSSYFKDIYCQLGGLYEVVVFYTYNDLPDNAKNNVYYQVFTFIINNKNPEIKAYTHNPETSSLDNFEFDTYTNRDVRLMWQIPTYFQNDVYIDITRTGFSSNANNFVAQYKALEITSLSGLSTDAIKLISAMGRINIDGKNYYYVDLKLQGDTSLDLNGHYEILIHYGFNGASNYSEAFTIDKEPIAGLNIQSALKNMDGTFALNVSNPLAEGQQIVNTDFTFRFNPKASNANIYVYYDKIDLTTNSLYDELINTSDNSIAITTTSKLTQNNISTGTPYIYNYTHLDYPKFVASGNIISSNTSCIYLFRLTDDAGNSARFVVLYDTTSPRFITSPSPDPDTGIISDTTRALWGDYKAIKVDEAGFALSSNEPVTNYSKESDNSLLSLTLRYMNSANNSAAFKNLKVEEIGGFNYILIPLSQATIEDATTQTDIDYDNTNNSDSFYFFPSNPIIEEEDSESGETLTYIDLPKFEADGKVDDDKNVVKIRYLVESYTLTSAVNNYNENIDDRFITVTYIDNNRVSHTIHGSIGKGTFYYTLRDAVGNKSSRFVSMNLDKTQTTGLALFDYSNKIADAEALPESDKAYSASALYISSRQSQFIENTSDANKWAYTVTYKHYPYDTSLYDTTKYSITNVELISAPPKSAINITLTSKTDSSIKKTVEILLTDEYGEKYPQHSYPYSLEGKVTLPDTNGNPKDVYSAGKQFLNSNEERVYSQMINSISDSDHNHKLVTEEGLYIFKRTYTNNDLTANDLGLDTRTIYLAYYIDRNGIINISSTDSVVSTMYNIGNQIEFNLGNNYSQTDYQKKIDAKTIQNNQKPVESAYSNANNISTNLFDTNKIQVEFRMAQDKHDFVSSISNFRQAVENAITSTNKDTITQSLNDYTFNSTHFENLYKIDLSLKVGNEVIIDEKEGIYSTTGIAEYLKNDPMAGGSRGNTFDFYLDTASNPYILELTDQAGTIKYLNDRSYTNIKELANKLQISFNISHTAPTGNVYGKYYGRHDYDENKSSSDTPLSIPSIPTTPDGQTYNLLSYLKDGQLEPLSQDLKSSTIDDKGNFVKLYSTNNETMIFAFSITQDEYQAQIDPRNVKIYKDGLQESNLILNRVDGDFIATTTVTKDRQSAAWIRNEIDGVTYYAIVIFDNNLDTIVDDDEEEYLQYRLLDPSQNPDDATYYIKIQYVGQPSDYIGKNNVGQDINYFSTTYEISVDRIKPIYNLTKLMALDKYVYNTIDVIPNASNYSSVFEQYSSIYNFAYDQEQDFYRSDLENYFFALDTRKDSSFVFESISDNDNDNTIYIRRVEKDKYKFSVTPDDYKAYFNATYLQGHPQFTPSSATTITSEQNISELNINQYYRIQFSLDGNTEDQSISAHFLKQNGILHENRYYEIIEQDEAGNYRVYAVFVPQEKTDIIRYSYYLSSSESSRKDVVIMYENTPYITSNGMSLQFTTIQTTDNFLRANLLVSTESLTHAIEIYLDPVNMQVRAINRTLNQTILERDINAIDKNGYTNTTEFVDAINSIINDYYAKVSNKSHEYYSQYGYKIDIDIVNRIGVSVKDTSKLYNYEIDYVVAGSTLSPIFRNGTTNFTMTLEGQKGSTYLTDVTVYKFNQKWIEINSDNSPIPQIFDRSEESLKEKLVFTFNRGVYKFIFTDNFNRINEFFYEYGISSSQNGGALSYAGKYTTLSDGYTYCSNTITYTYDSSVYNVYIKFSGKIPSEDAEGEYDIISDSQNLIVFNSSSTNNAEYLRRYGIVVSTSGNTTTITFSGVKDPTKPSGTTDLSKYHIKTILASTSTGYTWGSEATNKDIFVYDKNIALYTAVPNAVVKNLSGNTLDTSEHLNLTEDFELSFAWPSHVVGVDRLDFNPRIILTRTYTENGIVKPPQTSQVLPGTIIKLPGDYTAHIINDLGTISKTISFTRGEGEISMYAVYAVNSKQSTHNKLTASSLVSTETTEDNSVKVLFTYFTTTDYFSYRDASTGDSISIEDMLLNYKDSDTLSHDFVVNTTSNKYIDVRVNSNLSIKTAVYMVGDVTYGTESYPYVKYKIYSTTKTGDEYIYRFIQIVFVDGTDTKLASTNIIYSGSTNGLVDTNTSLITSSASTMKIEFLFGSIEEGLYVPDGDTIFVDRYYNGNFVETITIDIANNNESIPGYASIISTVGLHEFVIRDLAGRVHTFDGKNKIQIYLINEILFTVNGNTPINNQVFNSEVAINVLFTLSGLKLYDERSLTVEVSRNGNKYVMPTSSGELTPLTESGYYTVTLSAITQELADGTSPKVTSVFNFVILNDKTATSSFSISKGTGFSIEKLVKIVNGERTDITNSYSASSANSPANVVLWLSYADQGNSNFEVTLRNYDNATNTSSTFTFNVWINSETPIIVSSIPAGTSTKENITINFNPGIIYTQIGNGYITLNGNVIANLDENSEQIIDEVNISDSGEYWLRIYNDDGILISAYKFTKSEPMNGMTRTILIVVAILAVVVVGIFFFLRRKGKYR